MNEDKKPCEYWPLAPKTGYYNIGGKRVWLEAEDPFPEIAPRTWVDLTKKEVLAISKINMDIIDMIYFVEAKVREKNHG